MPRGYWEGRELRSRTCKKCGEHFSTTVLIDGKYRSLSSRKYCLVCSPFDLHNTKTLHEPQDDCTSRMCKVCGKPFEYRGKKDNPSSHRKNECGSCRAVFRAQSQKAKAIAYKGGECVRCGYHKYAEALCFHHRNPGDKVFTISGQWSISWERLRVELDKCDLLCLICHAEIHAEASDASLRARIRAVN